MKDWQNKNYLRQLDLKSLISYDLRFKIYNYQNFSHPGSKNYNLTF